MERIEDCADLEGIALAEVEKAYRRGFDQGANAVVNSLDADVLISDIDDWLKAVGEWRRQSSEWNQGEQVKVVDPLNPMWVKIPMSEALDRWRERWEK